MLSTIQKEPAAGAYEREKGADRPKLTKCCAKCRRGVPGFGDLPCGYNLACPNDCHNPNKTKETQS
jgi:hypothetical protein